jgi:hypothetical protein
MSLTDAEIVTEIRREAEHLGLAIDTRRHGGHFCTVYLEAPSVLPRDEQESRLRQAKALLEANGLCNVVLTRFNNPPYLNRNTGKMEEGHPRHGDPLIEIDSVWWVEEQS